MERNYFKSNRGLKIEMSPVIFRLQPLKEYQSPWKFFPSIHRASRSTIRHSEDSSLINIKRRKIKLELPKINTDKNEISEESSLSLEKKSLKSLKKNFLNFHDKSIKFFIERTYSPVKRTISPLRCY